MMDCLVDDRGGGFLTVEKLKIRSLFKNGEMQGSEKSQDAQCTFAYISGLTFFADAADRRFSTDCYELRIRRSHSKSRLVTTSSIRRSLRSRLSNLRLIRSRAPARELV